MTGTIRLSSHITTPTVDFYLSADQHSQSITGNSSVVRCYIRAVNRGTTGTFYSLHDAAVTFTVAGSSSHGATGTSADLSSGTANGSNFWEYGPYDLTVNHNADGTGSAKLTFHVSYPGAVSGGGNYSWTLPLTTIPRATTPSLSSSTVAVGGTVDIALDPATEDFSHRVWYAFGGLEHKNDGLSGGSGSAGGTDGTDGYWATDTGDQTVTLTVPVGMAAQMPGLSAQTLTVSVDTYSSGSKIGTTKTATVSVTPAGDVIYLSPTIDATVIRSLSDGTPADAGVCATLTVTAAVSSIDTGAEQNELSYLWEVSDDGTTWQTLESDDSGGLTFTDEEFTYTDSDPGTTGTQGFATTDSYLFRLTVTDAVGGSASKVLSMTTAAAILDIYDEPGEPVGIGIGALYDTDNGGRIQIDGESVFASDAETQAGTDTGRAVTPAGLASAYGRRLQLWRRSAANFASTSSMTALQMTSLEIDNGLFTHSSGVLTCVVAGTYLVTFTLGFPANATSLRGAQLLHSSGATRSHIVPAQSGLIDQSVTVVWPVTVAVGDTITLKGLQISGVALNVSGDVLLQRLD